MLKQKYFHNLQNKIYFIPSCFSLAALFLSIIVIILDTQYASVLAKIMPAYMLTSPDLAETILSTLAGSLFGMITVSFSTIMVVLTMYSSQFSPRTMQDFLQNRDTLKVLGVFLGGFIYSILTLLFLKEGATKNTVFSSVFGVIIGIICLGYFVFFIHHAANSVQVNKLIKKLRDEIIEIVDKVEERNNSNEQIKNEAPADLEEIIQRNSIDICADDNGYIKFIYDIKLRDLADEQNLIIKAEKMIGDYVTENSRIFSLRPAPADSSRAEKTETEDQDNSNKKSLLTVEQLQELAQTSRKNLKIVNSQEENEADDKEEDIQEQLETLKQKVLQQIVIDNERSRDNDIEFGLLKLTEVALRAISPGINDPNTAVFCINQLGWVLSRIAVANIENTYYYNEEGQLCFMLEDISFSELLYKTFFQLRHYGSQDVSVAGAILDALLIIAEGSPPDIKKEVWEFREYILSGFDKEVLDNPDKRFLNHKIYNLARETGNSEDTQTYFQV